MSYVYRRPWDYAVRRTQRYVEPPKTATNITPTYPDFVPRFKKTDNHTHRKLLTPVLSVFPSPQTSERGAGEEPKVFERKKVRRRVLSPPQVLIATTQATEAVVPGYFPVKQHTRHSHRTFRKTAEIWWVDKAAPSGSGYGASSVFTYRESTGRRVQGVPPPLGAWPETQVNVEPATITLEKAFRVEFERRALTLPGHDYWPVKASAAATVAAVTPAQRAFKRKRPPLTIEVTEVIRDDKSAATPSAFLISPFKEIRRHSPRRQVSLPVLSVYTGTAASNWRVGSPLPDIQVYQARHRRFQKLPPVAEYLRVKFYGPDLVRPVFVPTKRTNYKRLDVRPSNVYPGTPALDVTYPAQFRVPTVFRKPLGRQRRVFPSSIYRGYPTVVHIGQDVYVLTSFDDGDKYLRGEITASVYLQGEVTTAVYVMTSFDDDDLYLLSEITDVVYL